MKHRKNVGTKIKQLTTSTVCISALLGAIIAPSSKAESLPIFVLNSLDATISVIDPVTWKEKERISTGKEPHHLYLTPDQKSLVIANALGDSLLFLDPKTAQIQRKITGISDPYQLRFSPDMNWLVTNANRLDHVDIYRWNGHDVSLVKSIPTGKTPSHLWIDTKSKLIYSTMQDSDELVCIDLQRQVILWRMKTGSTPADMFGTSDDKFLFVALTGAAGIEVYALTDKLPRLVKTLPTGAGAHSFRAFGDGQHVLVSNRAGNTISKINLQSQTVVDTYPAPGGPDDMDISADKKFIYVSSRWARKMTVIDVEKHQVIKQIPVGKSPHGIWTLDHATR
ncbi:YncE family protein [Undibacterium sp. MH2W]|uniref:YncE family protein n=1 Tax=Undibacterium sp. MH2W TaxID=3413044 RepID=UPI003BF39DFD